MMAVLDWVRAQGARSNTVYPRLQLRLLRDRKSTVEVQRQQNMGDTSIL